MLFVFGKGSQGQLGVGDLEDQLDPVLVEGFRGSIVGAAGGENHTVICNDFGDLYAYGRGRQGQHGNGTKTVKSLCLPEQVTPLQPERIVKVACGANHCLAVTVDGEVFQWGAMSRFLETKEEYFGSKVKMPGMSDLNKTRQDLVRESHEKYYRAVLNSEEMDVVSLTAEVANFGTFSSFPQSTPKLVGPFGGEKVIDIDGGYSFSLALTESGRVYSWGFNEKRQLGLSHRFNQEKPVLLTSLAAVKIIKVKCGQQHSLALSDTGEVYSWGLGVLGQLGHGECRDAGIPTAIPDIPPMKVDIACGSHHSLLLDFDGRVYTFGSSEYGQQAGSTQHVDWQAGFHHSFGKRRYYYAVPRLIENAFDGEKITSIVCGDLHNIGLAESGDVYTWGWGAHGALGHGDRNFQSFPKKIVRLHGEKVARVSAGSHCTYVMTENSESNFAFDFKVLINSPKYSDLTFVVKNREIFAHKCIVYSRCAYLRDLVENSPLTKNGRYVIENVDHALFLSVIKFIYTDHLIQTPMHHVPRIRELAILYGLGRLVSICNQLMKRPIREGLEVHEPFDRKKLRANMIRIGSENMPIYIGCSYNPEPLNASAKNPHMNSSKFDCDLLALVNSPAHSDIQFKLDDGSIFYAHKSILCARSDYFETIFDAKFKEGTDATIFLPEVSYSTFGNVLNFIYANEIKIDLDNAASGESKFRIDNDIIVDVLLAAGRFLLTDLKQRIEKELENRLELDIVMDIVLLSEMANALKLKKVCMNFFAENYNALEETEEFQQFSKSVNVETMQSIHFLSHKKLLAVK